jgi:hypothetical protein
VSLALSVVVLLQNGGRIRITTAKYGIFTSTAGPFYMVLTPLFVICTPRLDATIKGIFPFLASNNDRYVFSVLVGIPTGVYLFLLLPELVSMAIDTDYCLKSVSWEIVQNDVL